MKESEKVLYLGDYINSRGNINDTVDARGTKAVGIISQVSSILSSISLGVFYFDIAMVHRDSLFLNAILINSESWYFISKKNMECLEAADIKYMKTCFKSHPNTVREACFLDTGKLQIKYVIAKRRFMFLHHILKIPHTELIHKVYEAQKLKQTKGDWYQMIQSEKLKFNINLSDQEIGNMSKSTFKRMVDKKVNTVSFYNLTQSRKSKVENIVMQLSREGVKKQFMQPYL